MLNSSVGQQPGAEGGGDVGSGRGLLPSLLRLLCVAGAENQPLQLHALRCFNTFIGHCASDLNSRLRASVPPESELGDSVVQVLVSLLQLPRHYTACSHAANMLWCLCSSTADRAKAQCMTRYALLPALLGKIAEVHDVAATASPASARKTHQALLVLEGLEDAVEAWPDSLPSPAGPHYLRLHSLSELQSELQGRSALFQPRLDTQAEHDSDSGSARSGASGEAGAAAAVAGEESGGAAEGWGANDTPTLQGLDLPLHHDGSSSSSSDGDGDGPERPVTWDMSAQQPTSPGYQVISSLPYQGLQADTESLLVSASDMHALLISCFGLLASLAATRSSPAFNCAQALQGSGVVSVIARLTRAETEALRGAGAGSSSTALLATTCMEVKQQLLTLLANLCLHADLVPDLVQQGCAEYMQVGARHE